MSRLASNEKGVQTLFTCFRLQAFTFPAPISPKGNWNKIKILPRKHVALKHNTQEEGAQPVLRVDGFKSAEYMGSHLELKQLEGLWIWSSTGNFYTTVYCIPVLLLLHFYFSKIPLCFSERTLFAGRHTHTPPSKGNKSSMDCLYRKREKKLYIFIHNMNGFHIRALFRVFLCFCTFVRVLVYKLIHL